MHVGVFVQISEKPLICASARGNIKLVELLLTYGADINQKDRVTVLSFSMYTAVGYVLNCFDTERWEHSTDTGMPLQPSRDCKGPFGK